MPKSSLYFKKIDTISNFFLKFEKFISNANAFYFILIFSFLGIFMKFPGGILGNIIGYIFNIHGGILSSDNQLPIFEVSDFIYAGGIGPLLETFTGQLLPIHIARKYTRSVLRRIILSATLFALFHLPVVQFLPTAFLIGLCLAWAYEIEARMSLKKAFFYTAIIHSLINMLPIIVLVLLYEVTHLYS